MIRITSKITHLLKQHSSNDLRGSSRTTPTWRLYAESITGIVTLFVIAAWIAADLWWDYATSASVSHFIADSFFAALAMLGVLQLGSLLFKARFRAKELQSDLLYAKESIKSFRREKRQFLQGLGETIEAQFIEWKLSVSEREVGLLLLKGLSIREIADMRETSERTARHQALAIYAKAGVSGRAELSAFFLEDLMLPFQQQSSVPTETERSH